MKSTSFSRSIGKRRPFLRCAAMLALASVTKGSAWAQSYPSRPVRVVAGFPGGTGPDLVARMGAQKLQEAPGTRHIGWRMKAGASCSPARMPGKVRELS